MGLSPDEVSDLMKAADEPLTPLGDETRAGSSYQSHFDRGDLPEPPEWGPGGFNDAARQLVDKIIHSEDLTATIGKYRMDYFSKALGVGARFINDNGILEFRTFIFSLKE